MTFQDPNYNPFDPNSPDYTPETKPTDEIIRMAITTAMMRLRVHLPGQIVKVLGNQRVNVQPLIQTRYVDGTVKNLPVIQNVTVQMPAGGDFSIKLPIAVGDTGSLLFSDRSLDVWANGSGGVVDPQDSRMHDLQDCVFVPGLLPFSKQTQDSTSDLVITNGSAKMRVQKPGKLTFSNGTNELMDLLDQITQQLKTLANTLSTDTVNTMLGPMQLNAFSTYQTIGTTVADLVSKLETLKGS